jgi:hypothetical protein
MRPSKAQASLDSQPLRIPVWSNLATVDELASTDKPQFQLTHLTAHFFSSGCTANLPNNLDLPFLSKFLPHPKQVIELTLMVLPS